jgi:hypothetical protein
MRGEKGEPWTEVLSWEPRAFVYHNFLVSPLPHSFLFGWEGQGPHVLHAICFMLFVQEILSFVLFQLC